MGRIVESNLKWLGLDLKWLKGELKKQGYSSAESIFLMLADRQGRTYIAERDDANAP